MFSLKKIVSLAKEKRNGDRRTIILVALLLFLKKRLMGKLQHLRKPDITPNTFFFNRMISTWSLFLLLPKHLHGFMDCTVIHCVCPIRAEEINSTLPMELQTTSPKHNTHTVPKYQHYSLKLAFGNSLTHSLLQNKHWNFEACGISDP